MSAVCWNCAKPISDDDMLDGKCIDSPKLGLCHVSCGKPGAQRQYAPKTEKLLRIMADERRARIPSRYQGARFADFDATHNAAALAVARRLRDEAYIIYDSVADLGDDFEPREELVYWTLGPGHHTLGLLFTGPVGVGKTLLACALGLELLPALDYGEYGREPEDGLPLFMVTAAGLVRSVSNSWRKDADEDDCELLDTAQRCDVLILDDLGGEVSAEWATRALFDLVDHRYTEGLPIFATTNLMRPADFTKRYGERITSRLFEMCDVLKLGGPDMRKRRGNGRLASVPADSDEAS